MEIKPIKTEKDYDNALLLVDELWSAKKGTPQGDEKEVLITLIEAYENKYYPIEVTEPVAAIKYVMQEKNLKPSDLTGLFGSKNLVTEVLNRERSLTLKMIKALHKSFGIPYDLLIA